MGHLVRGQWKEVTPLSGTDPGLAEERPTPADMRCAQGENRQIKHDV